MIKNLKGEQKGKNKKELKWEGKKKRRDIMRKRKE